MQIQFYNNNSDNRVVHKRITPTVSGISIDATGEIDVFNPTFILDRNDAILLSNYMHVPKFNRYYYITEASVLNGNQIQVFGHCDVLMSFWDAFKGSPCTANRSSSNFDDYLEDDMITIHPTYRTETRRLSGEFTPTAEGSNHYVLTVGGMDDND